LLLAASYEVGNIMLEPR